MSAIGPNIDKAYYFTFNAEFSKLNGTYVVKQILAYDEFMKLGIDLSTTLYSKVDKDPSTFDEYSLAYRESQVYKLFDILDEEETDPIYIPSTLLALLPNPDVKQYGKLIIALDLGVYANKEEFEYIINTMQEIISASTGITSKIQVIENGTQWMLESDYKKLEEERATIKKGITNYYSATVTLQKQLDSLKTQLIEYEKLLIELSNETLTNSEDLSTPTS